MAEPARRPETALRRLTALARDEGAVRRDDAALARGRARFVAAIERPEARRLRVAWWMIPAVAAIVALLVVARALRPEPAITCLLDGAPARADTYVRAGPAGATARFSEGTTVAFDPGARGRIEQVGPRGARIGLEAGAARFRVAHLPGAAWVAGAGPFTVTVTGTAFDLGWDRDRLELTLHEGSVIVRGPLAPDGIAVRRGQRLVADVGASELVLTEIAGDRAAPPPSGVEAPAASQAQAPAVSAKAQATARASASAREAPPSYRDRVARGDFRGVLDDADARGVDGILASEPLSEVAAIADAARYAGRSDLARRALEAERARFAGSPEARSAAFLLGRMAEAGAPAAAIGWYDRYLAESPAGSLAAEALGRKMLVVKRQGGAAAARPVAEAYLARYPAGAFAAAATEILGER